LGGKIGGTGAPGGGLRGGDIHRNKTDKRVRRDPVRVGLPRWQEIGEMGGADCGDLCIGGGDPHGEALNNFPPLSQMASDRRLPQRRAVEEIRRAEVGALNFDPQDALEPSQSRSSDFPAAMWSFR
jgi:hypothetical protein